jgi:hypothetical protein
MPVGNSSPVEATNSANQGRYITVGKENGANIELYYEDHGSGRPVNAGLLDFIQS